MENKRINKKQLLDIGKMPPQSVELEEAILGAVMLEQEAFMEIQEYFKPVIFYKEAHERIANAILTLKGKSEPADILTVTQELKRTGELELVGGAYYITQLTNRVASSANIQFHMRLLVEFYVKREVICGGTQMIKRAYEESSDIFNVIDEAGKTIMALTDKIIVGKINSIRTLYNKFLDRNHKIITNKGMGGVPSGFQIMDRITGGWQNSDLIIIAARPAMGKTSLALNYARNAAVMFKKPTLFFSLEMSNMQLTARLVSNETGEDLSKFMRDGIPNDMEIQINMQQCGDLINAPLFIDDTPGLSVFELKAKARKKMRDNGIELIVVDYLQLMHGSGTYRNREEEVSDISRSLKAFAKELDIPIIALSQLSREVEKRGGDPIPKLSDLRESGSIEQDADMVIFVHRPEYYGITVDGNGQNTAGKAEAIIAKNRNGPVDKVKMGWEGKCTRFIDVGESFAAYELNTPKSKYIANPNKFIEPKTEDHLF